MSKLSYSVYFMNNGRMVFINDDDINTAINTNKEILVICNSWSGGYSFAIGADETYDEYFDGKCWSMYTYDIRDKELTPEDMQKFYKVIFTSGDKVMMESREEATVMYRSGYGFNHKHFEDADTKYDYFKRMSFSHIGATEDEFEVFRREVNVEWTYNMLTGTKEEKEAKKEALKGYHYLFGIKGEF